MARPRKEGCDYFPQDTEFSTAVETLISAHGNDALALWMRFKMQAFADGSGRVDLSNQFALKRFCEVLRTKEGKVKAMVRTGIELGVFEAEAWDAMIIASAEVTRDLSFVQSERARDRERRKEFSGGKRRENAGRTPGESGVIPALSLNSPAERKRKDKANSLKESAREARALEGSPRAEPGTPTQPAEPYDRGKLPERTRDLLAALVPEVA